MAISISLLRRALVLLTFTAFGNTSYAQPPSEEEEWQEAMCADPVNVLFVGNFYSMTYGMKELCKNVTPDVIPDLEAAIRELRSRYPEPFGLFDKSPYLDGAKKSNKRSHKKLLGTLTKHDLRILCANSAKQLRNNISTWGPAFEKWMQNRQIATPPRAISPRSARWIDEALLHDGRTVEVQREVAFHFGGGDLSQACTKWPDEHSLEAKNPDTGKPVKWSGEKHVNPILLDFVDGIPYLAVMSMKVFSNVDLYGCPEIPFVFLKYADKAFQWVPVSRDAVPSVLRLANLSDRYDGTYMRDGRRQTKEFISGRYKTSDRSTNDYLSSVIPKSFEDWDYSRKERFRNERTANDCRPALLRPVDSINPKPSVPPSQNVMLEILETKNYDPVWIIEGNSNTAESQWSKLAWDSERSKACKKFFQPADPNNPQLDGWQSFINDPSGKKITVYTGNQICDADTIWMMDYVAERGRMVLIKVSPAGEVIYRISFEKPNELMGFMGGIMSPTLKAKDGYVYFDWWNSNQSGGNRHVKRAMKIRFKEPLLTAPNTSLHRTPVPLTRSLGR